MIALLERRAQALRFVREFFFEKGLLELDLAALSLNASIDQHIQLMSVQWSEDKWAYLHSSPELGMKLLLAQGLGDCYQLSHVFRKGERGALHSPEFTMIEWYRLGCSLEQLMEESLELAFLFLGKQPVQRFSYEQLFLRYLFDVVCCGGGRLHLL